MTTKERSINEIKESIAKPLEEFILDCKIEWPYDITDISDIIDLEAEMSEALEDYEFSEYQMICIVEYMFKEYKDKMERHTIRELINDVIKYDVPRIVARYMAKEHYDYPKE